MNFMKGDNCIVWLMLCCGFALYFVMLASEASQVTGGRGRIGLDFSRWPQPSQVIASSPAVSPQKRRRSLTTSKPVQEEKIATHKVVTEDVFIHVGDARFLYKMSIFVELPGVEGQVLRFFKLSAPYTDHVL